MRSIVVVPTNELTAPLNRLASSELRTFLSVGGAGYLVDVAAFNTLRSAPWLTTADPAYARILAVAAAMVVTYLGNRLLTWRGRSTGDRRREISRFVFFNIIGLGISVGTLLISHDLLGLTSRLADNVSANVVGLALGTLFRYWSYKRFVFTSVRGSRTPDQDGTLPARPRLPVLAQRTDGYVGPGPPVQQDSSRVQGPTP